MASRICSGLVLILVAGLAAFTPADGMLAQDATPTASTAAGTGDRTDVRYVVPFTPNGLNPSLTSSATEEGVCGYPSSAALDRPDAWDCIGAEDQVYDPCFENPFITPDEPAQVACMESPFITDVVVLTLTEPLVREKETPAIEPIEPTGDSESGPGMDAEPGEGAEPGVSMAEEAPGLTLEPWDLPWALELVNGDRCTLLGGDLTVMAGQTVQYGCANGGMVLGEVDHSQSVWTANYLAEGDVASSLVEVAVAWS